MPDTDFALTSATFKTFGELLRYLRRRAQLSQRELAIAVGYSEAQISRLEQNQRRPDLSAILALFVPALDIEDEPQMIARLAQLVAEARGGASLQPPSDLTQAVGAAPVVRPKGRVTNVPAQLTSFIGREHEAANVRRMLLETAVRLVTLIGPGGIGKTRLSQEVARQLHDEFGDGVWFVDLAPISDPALVAAVIAQTLGIREEGDRNVVAGLQDYLRDKRLLLVLDNFEQLVAASLLVSELLQSAAALKVLVTSRMPLRVRGEHEVVVRPLTVPIAGLEDATALVQCAAVQLFVERAQAVKADFLLTNANASTVARICSRLDGWPLAIELAAVRVKLLAPDALLQRLDSRLKILTVGTRDLPARQQTLRATLDWSYDLLDADEQRLFARLAVFVGTWTMEAAGAICQRAGSLAGDMLDLLARLVDKSLVHQAVAVEGELRFSMLETMREYARERLAACEEHEALRRNHALYYLALTEEAEPHLRGPLQITWTHRLEQDYDNIRAAFSWSLEGDPPPGERLEIGARLVTLLREFWFLRGHMKEGHTWVDRILEHWAAVPRQTRADVLLRAADMAFWQDQLERTELLAQRALAEYDALGDSTGAADALMLLGHHARSCEQYTRAVSYYEQSLSLCREAGARSLLAWTHFNLAMVAHLQEDLARAETLYQQSLTLHQEVGDMAASGIVMAYLGQVATEQARYAQAWALYQESLRLHQDLNQLLGIAWCIAGLAQVVLATGRLRDAVRLCGVAATLLTSVDTSAFALRLVHGRFGRAIAALRRQVNETTFAADWTVGSMMSLEEAVAYAQEVVPFDVALAPRVLDPELATRSQHP